MTYRNEFTAADCFPEIAEYIAFIIGKNDLGLYNDHVAMLAIKLLEPDKALIAEVDACEISAKYQ
jgi:hypothetical protein